MNDSLSYWLPKLNDPEIMFWNQWLRYLEGDVYIRVSQRTFGGVQHKCIDVSNVGWPVHRRGQGRFGSMLTLIRSECQFPIFVENVLEPRLVPYLERRGFTRVNQYDEESPPCFILFGDLQPLTKD